MRAHSFEVERILTQRGVLARRDHPTLASTVDRLLRSGQLRAVLPGIYARSEVASTFGTRVLAAVASSPDVILVDGAAAKVSFWPELRVPEVSCAVSNERVSPPGFRFTRRRIPNELVIQRGRLRMTSPGLTALDLAETLGGAPIDQALRSRATTLKHLHRAMQVTPSRSGNVTRRQLLLDSRDEPWSEAERLFHRLLRAAGVVGWKANLKVRLDGSTFYLDVAFRRLMLAIEIDGRLHETREDVFESDRWRQNALVLDGWRVLRFTWKMLVDHPDAVMDTVRAALGESAR